jgi:Protein of unknown function (DUF1493)
LELGRGSGNDASVRTGKLAMRDTIVDNVCSLLEKHGALSKKRMRPEMQLLADFGLDGDDAAGFLMAFAKRFGLKLDGLDFSRFFHSEAELVRYDSCSKAKAAIRIQDLIQVVSDMNWKYLG